MGEDSGWLYDEGGQLPSAYSVVRNDSGQAIELKPLSGNVIGKISSIREDADGLHIDYELNDTGREFLADQAQRSAAWIRDHYGPNGEFRCPCDQEA